MGHPSANHGSDHELGHAVPLKVFGIILGCLIALTVLTVLVSLKDFGQMNLVVAMLVASAKATLVLMFFMHLKFEHPVTIAYAILPLVILGLLLGGVFMDNPTRTNGQLEELVAH